MNKFKVWIEKQGGAHKVARLIDVTDSAVFQWLRGDSTPRLAKIVKLVELGRGAFTASDILNVAPISKNKLK